MTEVEAGWYTVVTEWFLFMQEDSTLKPVVWILRVLSPVVLFVLYYWVHSFRKDELLNRYSRSTMLAYRNSLPPALGIPASLATIRIVDESIAPVSSTTSNRPGRGVRKDKIPKECRERHERKSGKQQCGFEVPAVTREILASTVTQGFEEKMNLELLLNYVAFKRKDEQRIFLVDDGSMPPPPPPRGKQSQVESAQLEEAIAREKLLSAISLFSTKNSDRADADVHAAINFKHVEATRDLCKRLLESNVKISESTFTLMIEACILASDLNSVCNLLLKMEHYGYCPSSGLLDKVMELYSRDKLACEGQKRMKDSEDMVSPDVAMAKLPNTNDEASQEAVEESGASPKARQPVTLEVRAKLSAQAALFTPMTRTPLSSLSKPHWVSANANLPLSRRTALNGEAKPFEPALNMLEHADEARYDDKSRKTSFQHGTKSEVVVKSGRKTKALEEHSKENSGCNYHVKKDGKGGMLWKVKQRQQP